MNENPDPLDRLLASAPPPPAPPWFEQRLMARLRREEAEGFPGSAGGFSAVCSAAASFFLTGSRKWISSLALALLLLGGGVMWHGTGVRETDPGTVSAEEHQKEIYQGLDAFAAYQEQNRTWNIDW